MKTKSLGLLVAAVLLAGCATAPRIDWKSRVGNYTYEQAVAELGPAIKVGTLEDGRREAQWLIEQSLPVISQDLDARYASPLYTDRGHQREAVSQPWRYLHLIFGADGKLAAWGEDGRSPAFSTR